MRNSRYSFVRGLPIGVLTGVLFTLALLPARGQRLHAAEELTPADAHAALNKAVTFFRQQVSAKGGYLWNYSDDLKRREGEEQASAQTAWVQPPGTPTVGDAFLAAYLRTGDERLLAAARETALALVQGQLQSGGWDYRIEFDEAERRKVAYRVDTPVKADAPDKADRPGKKRRDVTTLDDNTTQSALGFLMRFDQATKFQDQAVHDAVQYALDRLLQAQYPNGAWPQRFSEPPDPNQYPVVRASYPETWSREFPKADYRDYYTFNDNTIADMVALMLDAAEIYEQPRYAAAAERAGGFILLAQMPDPQPAWAQQYDADMHPAWARKFEPPAITGGESQQVLSTLLLLYRKTGQPKFLEPVPRAIRYLRGSLLPDGRLARFYELRTNKPLFFTQQYELTYRDDDLPTHYAFLIGSRLDRLQADYERLREQPVEPPATRRRPPAVTTNRPRMTADLARQAAVAVRELDARGAWVESGRLKSFGADDPTTRIISTRTFVRNLDTLSRFLAAAGP